MIASNKNPMCEQARLYYFDYLYEQSGQCIPLQMLHHIDECSSCKAEVDRLQTQLALDQAKAGRGIEPRDSVVIGILKHHFAYTGESVTCNAVKPFLPGLADPALIIRVPTPITVHIEKCQLCSYDLEAIRKADFTHKQLCRLGQLFAEEPTDSVKICKETDRHAASIAAMVFDGLSAETLRHVCVCPKCRQALYKARDFRGRSIPPGAGDFTKPCEAILPSDVFDYVVSYGIDPKKDEYAMFRSSLTSHLTNCPTCLEQVQALHNRIYGILEREESGIVTCVELDDLSRQVEGTDSEDVDADWPIEVQVYDEAGEESNIEIHKSKVEPSPETAQTAMMSTLKRFARPLTAAAVILIACSIFFTASVAQAIDLEHVYKALKQIKNVYIATLIPDSTEPVQEKWISQTLSITVLKTNAEWALWDLQNRSIKSKNPNGGLIETTRVEDDALSAMKESASVPWGLLPFANVSSVPDNAKWQQVADEAIDAGASGIEIYDLMWTEQNLNGLPVYKKRRLYIDAETMLLQKVERWQKFTEEDYKLRTVMQIRYPDDSEIRAIITEAGF